MALARRLRFMFASHRAAMDPAHGGERKSVAFVTPQSGSAATYM